METHAASTSNSASAGMRLSRSGRPEFGKGSGSALSMKWSALHDAAGTVAMIAGLAAEAISPRIRNFPAVMRDAGGWRRELAEDGIADLTAVMEPGLSALLSAHARGASPQPAALALWQEFLQARNALLDLTPPEQLAPMRRA